MKVPYNWLKDYVPTKLSTKDVAETLTMIGHALDKTIEEIEGDKVMDFEDRGNRADIMGIVGLARDLAAVTNQPLSEPLTSPIPPVDNSKFPVPIKMETEKVLRWTAVTFKNVKVESSKPEIAQKLKAYGMEVINNIVDLTNYVMIELGMPLHAFDLDKLASIALRPAQAGEKLTTLDGTVLELTSEDLVAADGPKALTLTTAVGGRESGISDQTQNILFEAGLYDQPTARRTALRHNIRNETISRLGKYLHPKFCELAVARLIFLMKELYGAEPENVSFDYYPNPIEPLSLTLTEDRLALLAGQEIFIKEAEEILTRLQFKVLKFNQKSLEVEVPYFRTDVTMEDDLVEEVLRIRGFNKLPAYLPQRPSPPRLNFPEWELEEKIRDLLVSLGFNETISQQITDIKDTEKTGLSLSEKIVKLENSWNQELNVLRPDLISPQLKYLNAYQKQGVGTIKIFEVGKTYSQDQSKKGLAKYLETRKVALTANLAYLDFKGYLEVFLVSLGLSNPTFEKFQFTPFKDQVAAQIRVGDQEIGKVGELKSSVLANFGLSGKVSHGVFYIAKLLPLVTDAGKGQIRTQVENFISEDYTFALKNDRPVGEFIQEVKKKLNENTEIIFKDLYRDEKMKKAGIKSLTLNVRLYAADPKTINNDSQFLKSLSKS